jgi:16S rRNA (cytidine1402-2'-O)-methyltransferase
LTAPSGALALVATPIGNLGDLSPRAIAALRDADEIWCEDTRRTKTLLTHAGIVGARVRSVHEHNEAGAADELIALVRDGRTIAYVSDAGTPGISDPGARLVAACAAADLVVTIVPGPSAVIAAIAISGLPANRFTFEGFLERKGPRRREALERIARSDVTSVVYESPARLGATIAELALVCGADRPAAVVRELTKVHETVVRGTLAALVGVDVRGECVIVVGPALPAATASDAELDTALRSEFAAGSSARDAAAATAAMLGVPRRRAYERALALRNRT